MAQSISFLLNKRKSPISLETYWTFALYLVVRSYLMLRASSNEDHKV